MRRPVLQLPDNVSLNLLNFYKPIHFSDSMLCVSCDQHKNKTQFYKIEMSEVIEGWDYDHWDNEDAHLQHQK